MSETLKEQIRQRYGAAARAVSQAGGSSCCGSGNKSVITENLYQLDELSVLPQAAAQASLGCGNPTALVDLLQGETVLDLGSGGGIDVLLSARRVGPTGKAYGLDMTDDMLALARKNQQESGLTNVEFLKGEIEAIPLPDSSVDVIISNCVINLSTDKDRVFAEAFRTLRPGGRFAVSDVVFQGDVSLIPVDLRKAVEAWTGCVAGALEEQDYMARLQKAGFVDVSITATRIYGDSRELGCCGGSSLGEGVRLISGFVRARKPVAVSDSCTVRPAMAADLPAVQRLLKEAGLPLEGLSEHFGPAYAVAADPTGRAIGAVGVERYGEDGLLRSVVVDPLWRGRAVGEDLVRDRLTYARQAGLRSVWLLTTTAADYFPRFGFAVTERAAAPAPLQESVEFAHACPGSATTMALAL